MKFKDATYSTCIIQLGLVYQSNTFFQKKKNNKVLILAQNDSIVHKKKFENDIENL